MTGDLLGSFSSALSAILAIAVGAAVGGALRYALAELAVKWADSKLPGTWTANMIACFVAGVAAVVWSRGTSISNGMTPALAYATVMIGFAGGLSTWSTLAGEIVRLKNQHFWRACGYLALTLIGGIVFAFAGMCLPPLVAD